MYKFMLHTLKPPSDSLNFRKSHQYKPPTDHQMDITHKTCKSVPKMSNDVISWPFQELRCSVPNLSLIPCGPLHKVSGSRTPRSPGSANGCIEGTYKAAEKGL